VAWVLLVFLKLFNVLKENFKEGKEDIAMEEKFASLRNLSFLLHEVHKAEELTGFEYFGDHDIETIDLIIETAESIAKDMLLPYFSEMDKNPPEFKDGTIKVHAAVKDWIKRCGQDGWIASEFPSELGGQQLPVMVSLAITFLFCSANYSLSVYPGLTAAAARVISSYCTEDLVAKFLSKMLSGEWQGTMAMTEPQAGSSLADITTSAVPTGKGYYHITGQKIFISSGDSDAVDNIVHLCLAKIKGAPAGVKGISLFVVPKKRIDENGKLEPNDVTTAGMFHKMGYKGAPVAHLSFGDNDDCRGYLVGEEHKGLSYMFDMMNEARLGVGTGAAAIASAAYYNSLAYAKERLQGRKLDDKDPTLPMVPIIEHADVRRMLLFQRAIVEGSLSLLLHGGKFADLHHVSDGEDKERYALLLDLLTPIAKSYPSEMAIQTVSQGLQIFGGSGYCDEYPLEQYFRDTRIHPIHEGTTAIHGMDLLGRKVRIKDGKAFEYYKTELRSAIEASKQNPQLLPYAEKLNEALEKLDKLTSHLMGVSKESMEVFLADSVLYLEFFGIVTIAWQWLLQGLSIQKGLAAQPGEVETNFYMGKLRTMKYFFHYELPKINGLNERLLEADGLTANMDIVEFED
jgi:alkylation response protein AidB-like acyl-CoA dehydrogenase